MNKVLAEVKTITIPTYQEPQAEEMPMFSENRVHQRSSGRPYPNKVVMQVQREERVDKEYKLVVLENEHVRIEILPEIGGRVYSAYDKKTGYNFFYKQHVIKPALIGVLGSWISGGVEFNWPFHHRASGFMPCDFKIEEKDDGSAICWLSEHDPIDRMKGMVGIVLRPNETFFETRMRLYNQTAERHSFLWWENAAVPVNEKYQIFFPQDVTYVNFHYLKSRTTYPIAANGVFNGIPIDTPRDISWHKNTKEATSYFASASDYDFFGGYDHGKECGVVHIGNHHVSPGKKMFTWAYNQLATSWENALTDTDGQYAELMAGSYSDNQPNFSWLAPYETKQFSQYWYPISKIGAPTFANLSCAFKLEKEENVMKLQPTKTFKGATVKVFDDNGIYLNETCDLIAGECVTLKTFSMPKFAKIEIVADGKVIAQYEEKDFDKFNMPPVITDMPSAKGMNNAQDLYLAGVHVDQYRDPAVNPDSYWKEALNRDINHIPSLIAMANYEYNRYNLDCAEGYALRAITNLNLYNERHQSGEAYYVYAKICQAKGDYKKAEDYYWKSSWCADCVAKAMTKISFLDLRKKDYESAVKTATTALEYGINNSLAAAALVIGKRELGENDEAYEILKKHSALDCLDHTLRYLAHERDFYDIMDSDAAQTCLDLVFNFSQMGRYTDCVRILENLVEKYPEHEKKMVLYTLGFYKSLMGEDGTSYYNKAQNAPLGMAYPVRIEEMRILEDAVEKTDSKDAKLLLGCLLYNKLHYDKAAKLFEECDDYISRRNLAVAYFSHLNRENEALDIMRMLTNEYPDDQQILYETLCLMDKMGVCANEKIELIKSHKVTRDDILTELAKAYNQAFLPDMALKTLTSHNFVPCEGGEHEIADQYMFAYLVKGKVAFENGDYEKALGFFKEGQILPQNLGAGIWNHCKRIPLKYHQALCLEKLGKKDEADEIFSYIANVEIEYFSNMHLKELPYYQAKSQCHLGQETKGQLLITKYLREWSSIISTKDNGYFKTTPFFISFVERPEKLRSALYLYLTALCDDYMGNDVSAKEKMSESKLKNKDNMFALFFDKFGFLN